jgi:hypothetical protein
MLAPWRPVTVLHAIQDRWVDPDIVVDITPHWTRKMEALRCFASQFHDPLSTEPVSHISTPEFMPFLEGRTRELGHLLGVAFGEGFTVVFPTSRHWADLHAPVSFFNNRTIACRSAVVGSNSRHRAPVST